MSVFCAPAALSFFLNVIFLYKPILGAPRSSFTAYLKDWGVNRIIAFCAGIICGLGNTFQFMGGQVHHSSPSLTHTHPLGAFKSTLLPVCTFRAAMQCSPHASAFSITCGLGKTLQLMGGQVQDDDCTCPSCTEALLSAHLGILHCVDT